MAGKESSGENERSTEEIKWRVLDKLTEAYTCIDDAERVDEVIIALYSVAVCLFPVHFDSLAGSIDEKYRDKLCAVDALSGDERTKWWNALHNGKTFHMWASFLLHDIATKWLVNFPISARTHVYDGFFLHARATEIVKDLVPWLQTSGFGNDDPIAVCMNTERLLVLCLLENDMVFQMAREFGGGSQLEYNTQEQLELDISRVSQLITSIPEKASSEATLLSAHSFFKRIAAQLFRAAEEWDIKLGEEFAVANDMYKNGTILFVGETLAAICSRGSTDLLIREVIPRVLEHVRSVLSSTSSMTIRERFESKSGFRFWLKLMEALHDFSSVERIAEDLLHQLSVQQVNDVEGYWILWMLFNQICKDDPSICRSTFAEKFLVSKVFPICCLRWINQFIVLECTPASLNSYNKRGLLNTVHYLAFHWSSEEFVESSPIEQQIHVTAALGLCLEKMAYEDLQASRDAWRQIFHGVRYRRQSSNNLIIKMTNSILLAYAKIINPEILSEETIDWEFGSG